MRRTRMRTQTELAKREHTLLAVTASATLGLAEAKGHKLPMVFGIDGTIVFGTVALFAAEHMGGSSGRMLQSLADGWLAIGSYKMGRAVGGAAIAGAEQTIPAVGGVLRERRRSDQKGQAVLFRERRI